MWSQEMESQEREREREREEQKRTKESQRPENIQIGCIFYECAQREWTLHV